MFVREIDLKKNYSKAEKAEKGQLQNELSLEPQTKVHVQCPVTNYCMAKVGIFF